MQDMTPEGCAASSENDTKRLIDKRDGKYYWVAKLKDGNCWMTQNLELDLTSGVELTPADSDVSANWDPGATTLDTAQTGSTSSTAVQSWNLGKAVLKKPNNSSYCTSDSDFSDSNCTSLWQDVSTWAPMTEYRTDGITYDASTHTYDAHYLAGNYCSYQAATANTAPSSSGAAPHSICPRGFHLPTTNTHSSGSFDHLLGAAMDSDTIVSSPFMFVMGGSVYPSHSLEYAGNSGTYWSSLASDSLSAYPLPFDPAGVYVATGLTAPRNTGNSVRCVTPSV